MRSMIVFGVLAAASATVVWFAVGEAEREATRSAEADAAQAARWERSVSDTECRLWRTQRYGADAGQERSKNPCRTIPAGPDRDAIIAEAQRKITVGLLDPVGTQFRSVDAYTGPTVCGELNARNSFGAYVGFRRFVSDGATHVREGDSPHFDRLWSELCQR